MCYDYSKLAGRIVEKFGTQYNFAIAMGLSENNIIENERESLLERH